jgi:hypothetical protein
MGRIGRRSKPVVVITPHMFADIQRLIGNRDHYGNGWRPCLSKMATKNVHGATKFLR